MYMAILYLFCNPIWDFWYFVPVSKIFIICLFVNILFMKQPQRVHSDLIYQHVKFCCKAQVMKAQKAVTLCILNQTRFCFCFYKHPGRTYGVIFWQYMHFYQYENLHRTDVAKGQQYCMYKKRRLYALITKTAAAIEAWSFHRNEEQKQTQMKC